MKSGGRICRDRQVHRMVVFRKDRRGNNLQVHGRYPTDGPGSSRTSLKVLHDLGGSVIDIEKEAEILSKAFGIYPETIIFLCQKVRDEALAEAAFICEKSVKTMSDGKYLECLMTPYELSKEIQSRRSDKAAKNDYYEAGQE